MRTGDRTGQQQLPKTGYCFSLPPLLLSYLLALLFHCPRFRKMKVNDTYLSTSPRVDAAQVAQVAEASVVHVASGGGGGQN